jgi:hypothetical protein
MDRIRDEAGTARMLMTGTGRMICWVGLGLFQTSLLGGCTRPAVIPPESAPLPPSTAPAPAYISPQPPATPAPQPPISDSSYRNVWKPAVDPREWKYIVLHHTATDTGSVESIHESHLQNKDKSGKPWLGIGYHFVIGNGEGMGDGDIEPTFRWNQQMHGAHAGASDPEYNQVGIGICLVGNFEEHPPTPAQLAATKTLIRTLKSEYRISESRIIGHRDVRDTECPGKLFPMQEALSDRIDRPFAQTPVPLPASAVPTALAERERSSTR